jgi:hypothetical protein
MMWCGPTVTLIVLPCDDRIVGLPFRGLEAYGNLVGFRIEWMAVLYAIAMIILTMHPHHGFWSLFQ